jgi:hypothetical protein
MVRTKREWYFDVAGTILLAVSFFIPFYELPGGNNETGFSGLNILKNLGDLSELSPSQIFLFSTPVLIGLIAIINAIYLFLRSTTGLFGVGFVLILINFGFAWQESGQWNAFFSILTTGFYLALIGLISMFIAKVID